ncbi:hypothetical protein B0I35DRAFT_383799 [Stachybotrys elegans]|uniref:Rhodopsin domain-containing protein n=1 Tax=Stachybotrys elegans TaxID=80388 RepID=A0A8K0WJJ6_9HYPO|nr:hypothetical protein B0I35DRAFT_383799 [Stachybotrys elegans]
MAAENTLLIDLIGQDYNNFDEPVPISNNPTVLQGLVITFLLLSWICVSFRLFVRWRIVESLGLDDAFVLLYLLCGTAGSVAFLMSIEFGTGQHLLLLTLQQVGGYLFTFYLTNSLLHTAAAFIKLSLLFQYLRVFSRGSLPYRLSIAGIVATSLWGLAFAILAFVPCSKVSDFWYSPSDARCWGYGSSEPRQFTGTFIAHAVLNTTLDLYILTIPMHLYLQSQALSKTRYGLMGLLALGAVVTMLSIWRLETIIRYQAGWYPTHDPTWYGPISILLGVLEVNVASTCASIPIFWPIISPYLTLGGIFVTHEIKVQVQDYTDREAIMDNPKDKAPSSYSSDANQYDSTQTINEMELAPVGRRAMTPQFSNGFGVEQADPFNTGKNQTNHVKCESSRRESRWWKI